MRSMGELRLLGSSTDIEIKRDTKSGIVNDPNGWFKDPQDLLAAIRRIVHLSVETVRIVERLPEPFQPEQMDLSIKG